MKIHLICIKIILRFSSLGIQIAHSVSHILFPRFSFNTEVRTCISENKFQEIPMAISYEIKHGMPYPQYSSLGRYFLPHKSAESLGKLYRASNSVSQQAP
jgi:hypothetical protein